MSTSDDSDSLFSITWSPLQLFATSLFVIAEFEKPGSLRLRSLAAAESVRRSEERLSSSIGDRLPAAEEQLLPFDDSMS